MDTIKFKLTDECITLGDRKLYCIEALKDFADVKKGEKGGFVEYEDNLSQHGNCWIYDDAKVFDNAIVYGNAKVYENAIVYEDARVYENARVCGEAEVFGNAEVYEDALVFGNADVYGDARIFGKSRVYGNAEIFGNSEISSNLDYMVFKNWWSSGRYFTWTRSNNMWKVGCFYGTGEELIKKAYKDSELSGREYKRIVKYVESILKDSNKTTIVNKIKQCLIKITKMFNL